MVLLTSSQVSVVITTIIIFLFTSALFLSGYVVQQQTVRDLRAAIKPREAPPPQAKLYLPKQFEARPSPREEGVAVEVRASEQKIELRKREEDVDMDLPSIARQMDEQLDLEEAIGEEEHVTAESEEVVEKEMSTAARRKKIKAEIMEGSEENGFKGYRRRKW